MNDNSNHNNHSHMRRRILLLAGLAVGFCFLVIFALGTNGTLFAQSAQEGLTSLDWGGKYFFADNVPVEEEPVQREPTSIEGAVANCRYGVAVVGPGQLERVDDLGSGAFVNFGPASAPAENEAQFFPKVSMNENKNGCQYLGTYRTSPRIDITDPDNPDGLRYWLIRRPSLTWLLGNEVDRGPDESSGCESSQGDMQPATYARALHDTIAYIRQYDPTAQTSVSGLVQVTPQRIQYLDLVWDAHEDLYGNPPDIDVFVMHIYVLPEATPTGEENNIAAFANGTNPALARRESGGNPAVCSDPQVYCYAEHDNMGVFAEQVVAMRQWMKNVGQQQKPLILTEYSILYPYELDGGTCFVQDENGNCFTPARVQNFMTNSFNYMETATDPNLGYALDGNRLVQQWFWFSISANGAGSVSNLYNNSGDGTPTTIRPIGQEFINHVQSIPTYINLIPTVAGFPSSPTDGTGTADVDIWVYFRNNGNTHVPGSFNVSFYSNAGLTNLIGSVTIDSLYPVAGCSVQAYKASVTWNNVTPGLHEYWAKVDGGNIISESSENDNVIQGKVFVALPDTYLPIIHR